MVDSSESRSFCDCELQLLLSSRLPFRGPRELSVYCCPQVEKLELRRIEKVDEVPVVVHGTYLKNWEAIGTSSFSLRSSLVSALMR